MIVSDGYSIEYHKYKNQIVIQLPQTLQTISDTVSMVRNRKVDFKNTELAVILSVTKAIVENEDE